MTSVTRPLPPPVSEGMRRKWLACTKCGEVGYYDYQPFSLSNPIIGAMPCGHARSLAVDCSQAYAHKKIKKRKKP